LNIPSADQDLGQRRLEMDISRKIGIGITMIVPGFVLGGLVWAFIGSLSTVLGSLTTVLGWLAVLGVEIVLVIIYALIITGRFLTVGQKA
jgi:hypothetical protein